VRLRALMRDLARASTLDEIEASRERPPRSISGCSYALVRNPLFTFEGRNRRPPRDPINAMLSLGYPSWGLSWKGTSKIGFDAALGCLHAPAYVSPSLMRICWEFRPLVVDRSCCRLVNRRQVVPADFGPPEGQSGWDRGGGPRKGAGTVDETAPFLPAALEEAASRAVGVVDSAG
jgi:CRISPR-associated protein Cas1